MVTDLNKTGKRKRIYTKHKMTSNENDNILLPEKDLNNKRKYSDNDSPYLPPKYSSKNSTFQSPQKTHPTNVNFPITTQPSTRRLQLDFQSI